MSQEQFYLLAAKILSQENSAEEKAEFDRLISQSPDWQEEYRNMEEIWNSTHNQSIATVDTEDAYLMHLARLKDNVQDFQDHEKAYQVSVETDEDFCLYPATKPWYRRWTTLAAATAIFGLGTGLLIFNKTDKPAAGMAAVEARKANNEITVKKGAKTSLKLPDGSRVWVNSDSKLSYPETFKGRLREVYLEGEAYFDVAKDPAHPFIVHTSGIDVRVLGTAFNVKAYAAEPTIEATLVHGSIEVTNTLEPNAPKVLLKHHEKLIFHKMAPQAISHPSLPETKTPTTFTQPAITISQIAKHTPDSAFLETAWVYNRLRFEEERFDELVRQMERWFDVSIRIENERIKSVKLTGSFQDETIEEALREMQYLVRFQYTVKNREIIIR